MTEKRKKPKGFGFVEMQEESVSEAIAKLDNTDFMGRTIRVTEANPKSLSNIRK